MHVRGVDNVQLHVADLERTRQFYREGLRLDEINVLDDDDPKIVVFEVGTFILLRFRERSDLSDDGARPVDFIGLELDSFEAVDEAFEMLAARFNDRTFDDVRETYADRRGPYGFYLHDPDGYRLEIYHYHDAPSGDEPAPPS